MFLNIFCKNYDIKVYGVESMEVLEKVLAEYGSVNLAIENLLQGPDLIALGLELSMQFKEILDLVYVKRIL